MGASDPLLQLLLHALQIVRSANYLRFRVSHPQRANRSARGVGDARSAAPPLRSGAAAQRLEDRTVLSCVAHARGRAGPRGASAEMMEASPFNMLFVIYLSF